MLDNTTKRRIDTARDILVGKVPDPKSQVEQITIALIYKFMDDMDAETEELGGNRTFFTGKYSKYGWRRMFDPKLSGFDMLNLYSEAIQQMNLIPTIPQLFRDIFKNAYLPYRDPETLKAFLKIINEFHYDHSERLGDAFEYLLSVLGSQGDAGQFRTPRHIIDFMVRVVDPKKNDRILDPACGTSGFLISSLKHILKQNSKDGKIGRGLTNDDRKKLAQQLKGYDISPDMVRLSLVNMYLHGFTQPSIIEYDTLTSEDRWNEYYDVIMANPPFMSPKGGIRPHKRFSVQSNRSEVLFVDYIAEHLTPNGRAAVIVPEGIIFQSGTAYKQLRKMLVEKYLWAVVSLPAGVFNPYSGVKTSILLLDKNLAKKADSILFIKVQNDGFDLGAQRRPIDKSDFYFAEELLKHYKQHLQLGNFDVSLAIKNAAAINKADHEVNDVPIVKIEASQYLLVVKNKIAANGEYNLSGDKYKIIGNSLSFKYKMVELDNVCLNITDGSHYSPKSVSKGYAYITVRDIENDKINFDDCKFINELDYKQLLKNDCKPLNNDILFSKDGTVGKVSLVDFDKEFVVLSSLAIIRPNIELINPHYLKVILKSESFLSSAFENKTGVAIRRIVLRALKTIQIPLPPLSIQQQIIAEIEGYQKVIDGARQVVENYKPTIRIHPDWQMVGLGEICILTGGGTPSRQEKNFWNNGSIKWISSKHINDDGKVIGYELINKNALENSSTKVVGKGSTIAISRVSVGKVAFADDDFAINQDLTGLTPKDKNQLEAKFLFFSVKALGKVIDENSQGLGVRGVTRDFISELKIPLPPFEEQEEIVRQLEMERLMVEGNKQLIARMDQKIKETIAQVWGEEKTEMKVYETNEEVNVTL